MILHQVELEFAGGGFDRVFETRGILVDGIRLDAGDLPQIVGVGVDLKVASGEVVASRSSSFFTICSTRLTL